MGFGLGIQTTLLLQPRSLNPFIKSKGHDLAAGSISGVLPSKLRYQLTADGTAHGIGAFTT